MFASLISQKFVYKTAILFMQIRGLKTQNFAWESGLSIGISDSVHPNYDKKFGSQLLLKNALHMPIFTKCHYMSLSIILRKQFQTR